MQEKQENRKDLMELNIGKDVQDEDLFYGKLTDRYNIAFCHH